MGVCGSLPVSGGVDPEARQRSSEIDKHLAETSRQGQQEYKILLLGSGESGKSTIVKQMKIIHQNGYTEQELYMFRLTVVKNVIESARTLALALRLLGMEPERPENRVRTRWWLTGGRKRWMCCRSTRCRRTRMRSCRRRLRGGLSRCGVIR